MSAACGAEDPDRPGIKCVRELCVMYHRDAEGGVWTHGAASMPRKSTDPVTVAAIVARTRNRRRQG